MPPDGKIAIEVVDIHVVSTIVTVYNTDSHSVPGKNTLMSVDSHNNVPDYPCESHFEVFESDENSVVSSIEVKVRLR